MLVVLHACPKDAGLALENVRWQAELDANVDHDFLLSYEQGTPQTIVDEITKIARGLYRSVEIFYYPQAPVKGWPQAPNYAFQSTAFYIPTKFASPWLWLEADAIPLQQGWLSKLDEEYKRGGKPLMGHVVRGVTEGDHVNGVAVYPPNVASISQAALRCQNTAWDISMAKETVDVRHDCWKLIDHVWGIENGERRPASGSPPVFTSVEDVWKWVNLDALLYHRCKDDSLIKWLRHMRSAEYNVPKLVPEMESDDEDERGTINIPHKREPFFTAEVTLPKHEVPPVEIFIVTYKKDIPWLEYCLKSIAKFCTGFAGTTLLVPSKELHLFLRFKHDYPKLNLVSGDEWPKKGHLWHMAAECSPDMWVPKDTKYVLHMDADYVFKVPTHPSDFFYPVENAKGEGPLPLYIIRTYESLYDPKQKVISDCAQWKPVTEKILGFPILWYTMCRIPMINDIRIFPEFRKWVEETQKRPFFEFWEDQRNEFPPSVCEYPALGAFAYTFFQDNYHWIDASKDDVPPDRAKGYWSWGGITPEIKKEIEGFLNL